MTQDNVGRRFWKNQGGSTIVEFAIVSVVFFTIIFGLIEYGLIMMTKIAIESATQQVSRTTGIDASVSGCSDRACQLTKLIQQKTLGIINPAYVLVTSRVISQPTDASPPIPDVCLDTAGVPSPPTCSGGYIANDGFPGYQPATAVSNSQVGGQNSLIEIRVSYTWQVIFPLLRPFYQNGIVKMSSSTVFKNEPFGT